jgi:hypothetical protein
LNLAEAGVTPDGTPYVNVDSSVRLTDDLLAHELSHIRLIVEGFPKLDLIGHKELHLWMRSDVLDVVQHRIFYPRLRAAGFRPEADRITEARAIISKGEYASRLLSWVDLASRYFRVAMETDDPELMADMAKWYRSRGWSDELRLATQAFERVRATSQWQPKDEVDACIMCASVLLRNLFTFTFIRYDTEKYGSVNQRYAVVAIANTTDQ